MEGGFVPGLPRTTPLPDILPLGASMCSSIDPNVFAVHHGGGLQVQQSGHNSETCTNRRAGFSCFKMSWSSLACIGVSTTARRAGVDPNAVRHELHGQGAAKRRNRGLW